MVELKELDDDDDGNGEKKKSCIEEPPLDGGTSGDFFSFCFSHRSLPSSALFSWFTWFSLSACFVSSSPQNLRRV